MGPAAGDVAPKEGTGGAGGMELPENGTAETVGTPGAGVETGGGAGGAGVETPKEGAGVTGAAGTE